MQAKIVFTKGERGVGMRSLVWIRIQARPSNMGSQGDVVYLS